MAIYWIVLAAAIVTSMAGQTLLKAGADTESPNAEGETTLMVVARTGNV